MTLPLIFPHEHDALIEALRRDLRTEQDKLFGAGQDKDLHAINVRMAIRLLEVLQPRAGRSAAAPASGNRAGHCRHSAARSSQG